MNEEKEMVCGIAVLKFDVFVVLFVYISCEVAQRTKTEEK
jgi:hypothetical protein